MDHNDGNEADIYEGAFGEALADAQADGEGGAVQTGDEPGAESQGAGGAGGDQAGTGGAVAEAEAETGEADDAGQQEAEGEDGGDADGQEAGEQEAEGEDTSADKGAVDDSNDLLAAIRRYREGKQAQQQEGAQQQQGQEPAASQQNQGSQQAAGGQEQQASSNIQQASYEDFLDDSAKAKVAAAKEFLGGDFDGLNLMMEAHAKAQRHNLSVALASALTPVVTAVAQLQRASQQAERLNSLPGLDKELPKVREWIGTLPSSVQGPMNSVLDGGNMDEMVQLIESYQKATGAGAASQVTAPSPKPRAAPAKAVVAATTRPKTSKGDGGMNGVDPNDFEAAFLEASG